MRALANLLHFGSFIMSKYALWYKFKDNCLGTNNYGCLIGTSEAFRNVTLLAIQHFEVETHICKTQLQCHLICIMHCFLPINDQKYRQDCHFFSNS